MKAPLGGPHKRFRQVVRLRSTEYDIDRPNQDMSGPMGESVDSPTDVTADLYLFSPEERAIDTEFGDRLDGDLEGLALPAADVGHNDELVHGGETYEVDGIQHLPDDDDRQLKVFSLTKKVNNR